jgi:ABC-type polysaccharide/polyol phosphate transport system ATPase subunit
MLQDHVLRWRKHRKKWSLEVLKGISFDVKKGEWIGIYGRNGSGKTTLLRILAGLLPATSGTVKTHGRISCFFELGVSFHPERSAIENIYMHGLVHGIQSSVIREQAEYIIDRAGVRSHAELPIKYYSTGMQMRLAFITAMHVDSDIYLLDEVLAVGDAAFLKICEEELKILRAKGKTVLMVNHGLGALEKFCDRVMFIESGILQPAPPEELLPLGYKKQESLWSKPEGSVHLTMDSAGRVN